MCRENRSRILCILFRENQGIRKLHTASRRQHRMCINDRDFGEGSASFAGFPDQPEWFRDNRDFVNISNGLKSIGFSENDVELVMGKNWLNFFDASFESL